MEGAFAPWHIVIVGFLLVVFFGSKRLPDSARSLGQALRIFKAETRGLRDPDSAVPPVSTTSSAPRSAAAPVPTAPPVPELAPLPAAEPVASPPGGVAGSQ